MKRSTQAPFSNRWQRGSVLVISIVLAALGTIGVAAWLSLLDARGNQVEQNFTAIQRRIAYNNSRALAYRAMYANHLHAASGLASDTTYSLSGNNGEATIHAFSAVPLKNESAVRVSCSGAMPLRSFSTDVDVDLSDGASNYSWQFQLRNYNPVLGGELLSIHPPVDYDTSNALVAGTLSVKGRAVFWDASYKDLTAGIRADQFELPNDILQSITFTDTSGNSVMPLNYPFPLETTGLSGTTPAYKGELDITSSTGNSHNANVTRIAATGTSLTLSGNTANTQGPGPVTRGDGPDDDTLEVAVATQDTATLMTTLPAYYPLSSRILEAVAAKTSPTPFTEDEIFTIFSDHIPIPNDALTTLMGAYQDRIGTRTDELHRANGTWVSSNGTGTVRVFLERPELPHLVLDQTSALYLIGQEKNPDAAAAAALAPVAVIIANSSGYVLNTVDLQEQNLRRLFFSVSTEPIPSGSPASYTYFPSITFNGSRPFPNWTMILDLQNTGAIFDASPVAGATITGGIRANREIDVASGTLTIDRQYDYDGYESLLSRNAWIEAYRK